MIIKTSNIMRMAIIAWLMIGLTAFGFAQSKKMVLHSNKKDIHYICDNKSYGWNIASEIKPDVLTLFDAHDKEKKIKFVSDIDSIEFKIRVNNPLDFIILYSEDTAYTRINFTNQLPNTISMANKLLALSMFWSEARYNFVFYDQLTFNWDSLYKSYIPLVMKTTNDFDYSEVMQKFVGSLQDAHTNFVSQDYRFPFGDYIGMSVRYFNDTLRIISEDSIFAEVYPLGSKIIKINGMLADKYMDMYVNPFVASKFKPTQQVLAAVDLLSLKKLDYKITLTYITPQGEIRTNTPPRDGEKYRRPDIGKEFKYDRDRIRISWIEKKNIAVLTLNSFNDPKGSIVDYFEKHKDTLYNADGIIIDIRQNRGGSTLVGQHFLKYLIKDSFFLGYGYQTRINSGVKKANGNFIPENEDFYKMRAYETFAPDTVYIEDSIRRFDCPVVILTSMNTVSAAEDFLIMLYERPDRPLFIGRPSFGSTGSPLVLWDWPLDNGYARICTRRVLFPYSKKPFNEGIIPDIWIESSFDEFMSNNDKDIEIAIKELEKQIQAKDNKE